MIRHLTASGVVIHDDHVLLIEHRKAGLWLYPGGHIDPNEDPAQAVIREIREEVGIDVELVAEQPFSHPAITVVPNPFTIITVNVTDTAIGPHQHIDVVYAAVPLTHDIALQTNELIAYRWVPLADISALPTPPELPSLITAAAKYLKATR